MLRQDWVQGRVHVAGVYSFTRESLACTSSRRMLGWTLLPSEMQCIPRASRVVRLAYPALARVSRTMSRTCSAIVCCSYPQDGVIAATMEPEMLRNPLVLAQPEPWAAIQLKFAKDSIVHMVTDIDHDKSTERTQGWRASGASCVVGLGGV